MRRFEHKSVACWLMLSLGLCAMLMFVVDDNNVQVAVDQQQVPARASHVAAGALATREYRRVLEVVGGRQYWCEDSVLFEEEGGQRVTHDDGGRVSCAKDCILCDSCNPQGDYVHWTFNDTSITNVVVRNKLHQLIECTSPTNAPTISPSTSPTSAPTATPSKEPTTLPTNTTTNAPTTPTATPSKGPTAVPTKAPTKEPTKAPTKEPSASPTTSPTGAPTEVPTSSAPTSSAPTGAPITPPTKYPTPVPTTAPSKGPTGVPTNSPSKGPTGVPTTSAPTSPTAYPTFAPTDSPRALPSGPGLGTGTVALISSLALASLAAGSFLFYRRQRQIQDDREFVKLAMGATYGGAASYDDDNNSLGSNDSDGGTTDGGRSFRSNDSRRSNGSKRTRGSGGSKPRTQRSERVRDDESRDAGRDVESQRTNADHDNAHLDDADAGEYDYDPTQEITKLGKELLERGFDPYGTTAQNAMHAERAYFNDEMQYYGRHRSTGRQVASTFGQMRKALTKTFARGDSFKRDDDGHPTRSTAADNPIFNRTRASLSEALVKFYLRHDPDKPMEDIDLIIDWLQMDAANYESLKMKLQRKYGEVPELR